MSKTKSLIGKKYVPADNSWSVNVTDCGSMLSRARHSYLAGTSIPYTPAKDCIIVSEPFICSVETIGIDDQLNKRKMIMVDYNNQTHMVLYYDECVENLIIKRNC